MPKQFLCYVTITVPDDEPRQEPGDVREELFDALHDGTPQTWAFQIKDVRRPRSGDGPSAEWLTTMVAARLKRPA